MTSANLEVQGLVKQYPTFRLNNVSFALAKGSIMGFVGENGAGKTTTIGCILNTLIKDGGSVRIFGKEMTDAATDIREDIGVVYDSNAFPDDLSPTKICRAMRGIYKNWDTPAFERWIQRFKLPPDNKISTFSKGMSMKLSIAAALAHKPRLLVLDEATSGLDPIVRDEILDVFLEFVQEKNNSILLSSHITSDLEKVADTITFIHDGNIIFSELRTILHENYGVLRCTAEKFSEIAREDIISYRKTDSGVDVLTADRQAAAKYGTAVDSVSIEDIMLLMVKGEQK